MWLALVNLDPNAETEVTANVAGIVAGKAQGEVLTAPGFNTVNTVGAPDAVAPRPFSANAVDGKLVLRLPRHSVTVVRLEP